MLKVAVLQNKVFLLALFFVFTLLVSPSMAEENGKDISEKDKTSAAGVVHLEGLDVASETEESGKAVLDRQALERMPNSTGSITEALKVMPDVQFDDASRSTLTGGSILPPKVSISGGKYYENNFSIDGISNNNRIDPSGLDGVGANGNVAGEAENSFVDPELIESVTVYSSNVPAKYGQFVGGVVDAKTRKPADEFGGKITYQHTRDTWATFRPDDQEEFETSTNNSQGNPKFTKHNMSAYVDVPLTENVKSVFSYSLKHATVPLYYMDDLKNQYRNRHNAYAKFSADIDKISELNFTVLLSKYEASNFVNNTKESEFDVSTPSYKFVVDYEREIGLGKYSLAAGFSQTETRRDSNSDVMTSWTKVGGTSTQWGSLTTQAREGGFGTTYSRQRDFNMKLDYESVPVEIGGTSNVFSSGLLYENVSGMYDQEDDYTTFYRSIASAVVIDNGQGGVIAGDQYARNMSQQDASSQSASYNSLGYYLQDELVFLRLTLRPGMRIEYDDLLENTNYAPRFMAELDVLGDQNLVFVTGANRYYGANLLTYALRDRNPLMYYTRTIDGGGNLSDWNLSRETKKDYSLDGLKTPYSDEYTAGVRTGFFGVDASLDYVARKTHDQFSAAYRKTGTTSSYELTNGGETDYWGLTFELSKTIDNHFFSVGATRSEQETNFSNFNDFSSDGGMAGYNYDKVYYNGQLIDRNAMPASNFNRPWVGTFTYRGSFWDKLNLTSVTRYLGGFDTIVGAGTELINGVRYYEYKDARLSSSIISDLKVEYEVFNADSHSLVLDLVVDNVFDETAIIDKSGNRVAGRQFWAGAAYSF
nr:TonB-dependent receptor plug domain-containing protein [uncultured Pseudodesulfovibrio sp.]